VVVDLRERLVKIGARIVRHGRSVIFQMAEVMVPCGLFQQILVAISTRRSSPPADAEHLHNARHMGVLGRRRARKTGF